MTPNAAHPDAVPLAVVIPAYRATYFAQAIRSLAAQTDTRFNLYVGVDGADGPFAEIVRRHPAGIRQVCHLFPDNLGSRDLVAQWERCIALTQGEPWIWLFGDDDMAEPNCVAAFYCHLDQHLGSEQLLRFNNQIIDDEGQTIVVPEPHPSFETGHELLRALVDRNPTRTWYAPDHIFSRRAYDQHGFRHYPRALFSDHMAWIEFSQSGGAATITDAKVHWRKHPDGTSSGRTTDCSREFWHAMLSFLSDALDIAQQSYHPDFPALCTQVRESLRGYVRYYPDRFKWRDSLALSRGCARATREPGYRWAVYILFCNCRHRVAGNWVQRAWRRLRYACRHALFS